MASLLLPLLVASLFITKSTAFNCSVSPIYVDIHKRAVHGTDTFQYGSFIGFGSPAQNQSLWPSLRRNETTVAASDFCKNSDLKNCTRSTRGNFDTSSSTTWVQNTKYVPLDASTALNDTVIYGQDDAHLYTHYFESDGAFQNLVHNFSMQVATNGSEAPGIVGLGLSSTLLQKLYDNGQIAGRTYSLYIGSGMDRAGGVINGSNTFGGYDAGRFTGNVHDYPMKTDNEHPLAVTVADIILNEPNGLIRNLSLFDTAAFPEMKSRPSAFEARITTDQYPMSLPYQLTQNYISRLAAEPSGNPDGSLKLTKPFNGTMTIVLDDGFNVTLSSEVMFNASGISPVAERDQNSTDPFYLSVAWLSQVYLMINYDKYKFHLAQAVPEAKFVMPTTFCPGSTPAAYVLPSKMTMTRAQLVGAILGGVIGGVFIIVMAISGFMWWQRHRMLKAVDAEKAKGKSKMAQFEVQDSSSDGSESGSSQGRKKGWFRRK